MHQMINDILAFSRVGREEMTLEQVDCAQLARDVLAEFETIISEKAAIVACEMLPTLISNATIMRVLLQNLIGNALKFHDGSRVPHINVSAVREKTGWQFCVRDNGIGIEPQYHAQVFAIFRRIHRKEEYPGMGIGLSTCKKLVELCGGMVWFESQPHAGTAFYFTIPIAEQGKGLS
jgi:two-component system sensor histidine kinase/response regulator